MTYLAIVECAITWGKKCCASKKQAQEIRSSPQDLRFRRMRLAACLLTVTFPYLTVTRWLVTEITHQEDFLCRLLGVGREVRSKESARQGLFNAAASDFSKVFVENG